MWSVIHWIIGALWLAIFVYWMVSARWVKAYRGPRRFSALAPLRLVVLVLIVLAVRTRYVRLELRDSQRVLVAHPSIALAGLVLCALGLGLAFAARISLGSNWGMPMTQKLQPELVTSGPYAYARHPIYGGLMLGMLGSALGTSLLWLLPLVLFGSYFIVSMQREERLMLALFPSQYEAYRKRTRRLIPFVI